MTSHSPEALLSVGFPELLALFYSNYSEQAKKKSLKEIRLEKERNFLHMIAYYNHIWLF